MQEYDSGVQQALDRYQEELREIISMAFRASREPHEVAQMVADSAFAAGWSGRDAYHPGMWSGTGAFVLVKATLPRLVEAILSARTDPDRTVEILEDARKAMVSMVLKTEHEVRQQRAESIGGRCGDRVKKLIFDSQSVDDDEALEIAVAWTSVFGRGQLFSFALYSGDTRRKCRCPVCLNTALVEESPSEAEAEAALRSRFGTKYKAFVEFGRYVREWAAQGHDFLSDAGSGDDSSEIRGDVQAVISRLSKPLKGG